MTEFIFFWIPLFLVVYSYAIYPLILHMLGRRKKKNELNTQFEMPSVSILIAMYNEENVIRDRIQNLQLLEYPGRCIEVLLGSDGCTDGTNAILHEEVREGIRAIEFGHRRGKASILNDLANLAKGEILVFSDANTFFHPDTVNKLVARFQDPTVGAVTGELVLRSQLQSVGGTGEVSYWNYENWLKMLESNVRTTLGATGAVYAIRKNLYVPLPTEMAVMDDFLIPMHILKKGFRVVYEPSARAYEFASDSIPGEFKRKVRIGAANFVGLQEYSDLLHPKNGFIAFALWSHKIIRWIIPFLLIAIVGSTFVLSRQSNFFAFVLYIEMIFGVFALAGYFFERRKLRVGVFGLPYYFLVVNAALGVGFIKFLLGRQRPTWDVIR